MFIQAFDGNKYCYVNDTDIYTLDCITFHEASSKDLDYKVPKPKKQYILLMDHLWRKSVFGNFVKNQEHHWNDEEKQYA